MITPCAKNMRSKIISRVRSSVKAIGAKPEFSARSLIFGKAAFAAQGHARGGAGSQHRSDANLPPAVALRGAKQLFFWPFGYFDTYVVRWKWEFSREMEISVEMLTFCPSLLLMLLANPSHPYFNLLH